MKIKQPLCITSRLLPGVRIGGAEISIGYSHVLDGRQYYGWYIDLQGGGDFHENDISSGVGGSLQKGLEILLSFLSAFADAHKHNYPENSKLFPLGLSEWAIANSNDIDVLALGLGKNPSEFIIEGE